jgi:hypothetical protein
MPGNDDFFLLTCLKPAKYNATAPRRKLYQGKKGVFKWLFGITDRKLTSGPV